MKLSFKPTNPLIVSLIIVGTTITGVTAFYAISQFGQTKEMVQPTPTKPPIRKITALGRFEPRSEVISLSGPFILNTDRIGQLLVEEGEKVKKGQIIAILDSRDRLQNALTEAQKQVKVAQSRLGQVKAGAKTGEISAQQATIIRLQAQWQGDKEAQQATLNRLEAQIQGDREAQEATLGKLEAEFKNAQAEYDRYQKLYGEGAISESIYDSKRLNLETSRQQLNEAKVTLERIERTGRQQLNEAKTTLERIERTGQQQLNEARANLDRIEEVRPVDIQTAQAEIDADLAAEAKAQTELNQTYIRSPINGQILKIHTRPGESISDKGIVDLAATNQMEVVAEIYQSDISKIREGQLATITGDSFPGEVKGKIRLIGRQVDRQDVFSNKPGENFDRKVIEVRIKLRPEDIQKVSGLTNSQVQVQIEP